MDDKLLAELRKTFGDDVAFRLNEPGRVSDVVFKPSSIATLDLALGGGIPVGRIMEIYGQESAGKSALACALVGALQSQGFGAMFVDMEYSLNPTHAQQNGMDMDNIVVSQPRNAELAMKVIETVVRKSETPMVIVLDSVAALIPETEVEADPGSASIGVTARLMSQMMRKLAGPTSTGGHVLIFTNQIRMKIGQMFGNPETTTGGRALRFYASIRLYLMAPQKIGKEPNVVGTTVRVKVVKNKVATPYKEAKFDIIHDGTGIDKLASTLDVACKLDIIRKVQGGSHYYPFDEESRFAGSRAEAVEFLRDNIGWTQEIYALVAEKTTLPEIGTPSEE